jgi:Ser/Thr protein kinase RdoA (MazF antagonist)
LCAAFTDFSPPSRLVGSLAGRRKNPAARWRPPPGFTRHAWDADGLTGEEPLWGRFWEFDGLDAEQKALILRARDTARRDLLRAHDGGLGYGLIHADFNFDNFLLRNGKVMALDFDDCGNGWHLFDLATITILFLGTDQYDAVHGAVVEGYRQERELTDETLSLMPLFYLLRVFTYLGWVHTRSETKSAQEIAPMVVEMTCNQAEEYLKVNA